MDPILLFNFLGSAASIASLLISLGRKEVTLETIREFREQIPEKYWQDLTSEEGLRLITLLVIDPDLLDDLTRDVQSAQSEYRRCLKIAQTSTARDGCDRRVERRICETLNRIMDRNEDKLPTDFLENTWTSYRCVRF